MMLSFVVPGFLLALITWGCSSLEMAVINKDLEKTKKLIENGADVNKGGTKQHSPLTIAATNHDTAMVHLLLTNGADINKPISGGKTPLYWAVYVNDSVMVRYLLTKGADVNIKTSKGETPLALAQKNGQTGIANMLINYNDIVKDTAKFSLPPVNKEETGQLYKDNKKEKMLTPYVKFVYSIEKWVPANAICPIVSKSLYKKEYGKVNCFGFGFGTYVNIHKNIKLFVDLNSYKYKQEIAEKGEDVHHYIGMGGTINLPLGAKYSTHTVCPRIGVKYVYTKNKTFHPWIGWAYGMNIWHLSYITWDEDKIYGEASGLTWRQAIFAGLDIKPKNFFTFTILFEAISPVANYKIDNLFNLGPYSQFDGQTYPTPRIGIQMSLNNW